MNLVQSYDMLKQGLRKCDQMSGVKNKILNTVQSCPKFGRISIISSTFC